MNDVAAHGDVAACGVEEAHGVSVEAYDLGVEEVEGVHAVVVGMMFVAWTGNVVRTLLPWLSACYG